MAQIDLTAYKYARWTRDIIYRFERHQENPRDPRFPWIPEDEALLEELFNYFLANVTPPPKFPFVAGKDKSYAQLKDYLQEQIIDQYSEVKANLPPADLIDAYDRHIAEVQQKLHQLETQAEKLAPARIKIVENLTHQFSSLDPQIIAATAEEILLQGIELDPALALPQALETIEQLATITHTPTSSADLISILADDEVIGVLTQEHPNFNDLVQHAAQTISLTLEVEASPATQYLASYVVVAASAGRAPSLTTTSPAQLEAALVTKIKPSLQAPKVTDISAAWETLLTSHQTPLLQLVTQTQQVSEHWRKIEKEFANRAQLSGISYESQQMAGEVFRQHIAPTLLFASAYTKGDQEKKIVVSPAEKIFARLGITEYQKGRRVFNQAYQAAYSWLESQSYEFVYAGSQPSVQAYYGSRSGSPLIRNMFNQFFNLATGPTQDKITQAVSQKFLSSSVGQSISTALGFGVKTAATAGTEAAVVGTEVTVAAAAGTGIGATITSILAGLGIADPEPITKVILAALTVIAIFGKKIWEWVKKFIKGFFEAAGATVAGVFGLTGAGVASVGGVFAAIGSGVSSAFAALGSLVIVQIATPIIVILASIPIVIVLILFIINNSAYIVPQAVGTITGGVPGQCDLSCFNFSGFSASEELLVKQAACDIQTANSCLTNRLCTSPISIERANSKKGYCGLAFTKSGQRRLELYDGAFDGQCNIVYSLSHELGHIINRFDPSFSTKYAAGVQPNRATCLPSYPLYDSDNAVACTVGGSTEEGNAEDVSETIAVFVCSILGNCGSLYRVGNVPANFFDSYPAHKQLLGQEFLSGACTQQSTKTAYVLEGNKSDVVISTLQEISTPRPTCTWVGSNSSGRTLAGAINANFFKTDGSPVGWAGYNSQTQNFGCGNSCATKVFNGSSVVALNSVADPSMAISGLTLSTANEDGRQVARTAMGVKGNSIFLVVLDRGSVADLVSFITQTLGVSVDNAILLDSGSSTSFCTGSQLTAGSNATVPVSVGLKNGTINQYVVP